MIRERTNEFGIRFNFNLVELTCCMNKLPERPSMYHDSCPYNTLQSGVVALCLEGELARAGVKVVNVLMLKSINQSGN